MGHRPDGTTLERINNSLGYSKDNCKWGTRKDQTRNRRNTFMLTINTETRSVAEWSEITGIKYHTIKNRIYNGWDPKRAISPVGRK